MAKEIKIKLAIGDKGKKLPITVTTLNEMPVEQLKNVQSILTDLNSKENVLVNWPDADYVQTLNIIYRINELLKFIVVKINHLQAQKLNFMRSLGWQY